MLDPVSDLLNVVLLAHRKRIKNADLLHSQLGNDLWLESNVE
jgi:hypothetical protein